jgi:hypothetical protein
MVERGQLEGGRQPLYCKIKSCTYKINREAGKGAKRSNFLGILMGFVVCFKMTLPGLGQ